MPENKNVYHCRLHEKFNSVVIADDYDEVIRILLSAEIGDNMDWTTCVWEIVCPIAATEKSRVLAMEKP